MASHKRQLHLGAFLQGVGHHLPAWRHPGVDPSAALRLDHFNQLAQIAEAGKFDAIFFADSVGLPGAPAHIQTNAVLPYYFQPLLLLSALAGTTKRIGRVATV